MWCRFELFSPVRFEFYLDHHYRLPPVRSIFPNVETSMRLFEGTEFDRPPHCEKCDRLEEECHCPPEPPQVVPPQQQLAKIQLEKRRKGKWVSVIRGLDPDGSHLKDLLTLLKNSCGAGGTIQEDAIEVQGNHVERITQLLKAQGYQIKT
jgi:translation initiation factor 1